MRARPKLGQHFLRDPVVLERIASSAVEPGDWVLEIGPGRGALTRHLLRLARQVVAVEIDAELAGSLPARCGSARHLKVLHADILTEDLSVLVSQTHVNQRVVTGNLPYYIISPILRSVFAAKRFFRSATFLMQEEVANRVVARSGNSDYGFLSCLCQLHSRPSKLFAVPPGAFSPVPRVRSALVRFDLLPNDAPAGLQAFLGACFRTPRKTLRNNLAGRYPADALAAEPSAGMRAGQLGVRELEALWRRLDASR